MIAFNIAFCHLSMNDAYLKYAVLIRMFCHLQLNTSLPFSLKAFCKLLYFVSKNVPLFFFSKICKVLKITCTSHFYVTHATFCYIFI